MTHLREDRASLLDSKARRGHAFYFSYGSLRNSIGTENLLDDVDHPEDEDYINFNIVSTYEQKSRNEW